MNMKTFFGAVIVLALGVGGFMAVQYTRKVGQNLTSATDTNAATGKPRVRFVKNPRRFPRSP